MLSTSLIEKKYISKQFEIHTIKEHNETATA